jgi:integrase
MAPEFSRFLLTTPAEDRRGRVFHPLNKAGRDSAWGTDWVSRVVCKIGERAGVVVNRTTKVDRTTRERRGVVKYASAHDLRRSFGVRWSNRVMPAVLKELMRHESIDTTMKYYVGRNAEATADALWAAFDGAERSNGNTNGNNPSEAGALRVPQETKQALGIQGLAEVEDIGLEPTTF